jgi:hypothetical protein
VLVVLERTLRWGNLGWYRYCGVGVTDSWFGGMTLVWVIDIVADWAGIQAQENVSSH